MSLMLRKNCQSTLDTAGLQNYHIDINQYNKNMEIVGECGKPFISISGITFSRLSPSREEIPFATELLSDFLATHKIKIDTYMKAVENFKKHPDMPNEKKNKYKIYCNTRNNIRNYSICIYNNMFEFTYDEEGTLTKIELNSNIEIDTKDLTMFKTNTKNILHLKKYFTTWIAYNEELIALKELKNELNLCDI